MQNRRKVIVNHFKLWQSVDYQKLKQSESLHEENTHKMIALRLGRTKVQQCGRHAGRYFLETSNKSSNGRKDTDKARFPDEIYNYKYVIYCWIVFYSDYTHDANTRGFYRGCIMIKRCTTWLCNLENKTPEELFNFFRLAILRRHSCWLEQTG